MYPSLLVHANVVPQDDAGDGKGGIKGHAGVRLRLLLVNNALHQQSALGIHGRVHIDQ